MPRLLLLAVALILAPAARAQAPEALRVADPADATRLRLDTRGGLLVPGTASGTPDLTTIPATGAGTRLLWWPERSAFRVGTAVASEWDGANVGSWSFAAGYLTTASAQHATALGRQTVASGISSTALGRETTASGLYSTAMGYRTTASDTYATALGRETVASGISSTALGFRTTASGGSSTALGAYASTSEQTGAFVVGDASTSTLLTATAQNQYSARFVGGYRLFTNSTMTVGAELTAGSNSWSTLSDSTRKEGFRRYDGDAVLAGLSRLRLGTWHYRGQDAATQRHWGPMAQDFYREFGHDGVGTVGSDTLIATGDADGVLFAAAQALEARTREQDRRIATLEAENATLRAELSARTADVASSSETAALRADLARLEAVVASLAVPAGPVLISHHTAASGRE